MRITNNTMFNSVLNNIQWNTEQLDKINWQASSSQRIRYASDDPTGTVKVMNLSTQQNKIEQYLSNITDSNQWLNTQDGLLSDVNDLLQRVHTLTLQAANESYTQSDRTLIAQEINQILEDLVQASNTTQGGSFLYGGTQNLDEPFNQQPFQVTRGQSGTMTGVITKVEYKGDFQPIIREIEEGIKMQINQPGNEVFMATSYTVEMPDAGYTNASDALQLTGIPEKGYFAIDGHNFFYNTSGKYMSDSLIDIAQKINTSNIGVNATVEGTYQGASGIDENSTVSSAGAFYINGTKIEVNSTDTISMVLTKINNASNQTGVAAQLSGGRVVLNGGAELTFENQYNNLLSDLGLVDNTKITGKYAYQPTEKTEITAGNIIIKGTSIAIAANASLDEVVSAINAETATTGVTASINNNKLELSAANFNGVSISQSSGTNVLNVLGIFDNSNRIRTNADLTNGSVTSNYRLKIASNDSHQFFLEDRASGQFLKQLGFTRDNINGVAVTPPNNIGANAVVTNNSIFNVLIQIRDDMLNNNVTRLNGDDIKLTDSALTNINAKRAEVGAKTNRIEAVEKRLNNVKLNNEEILSQVRDADLSEIAIQLTTLENVQKASLSVAARIFQLSLIDFMS